MGSGVRLAGRTVMVTGAAGGIGRALALRCAAEGARVAVTDVQAEALRAVGEELGPGEVFFANAGVAIGEDPVDTPDEVWEEAFAVNVRAHVYAARRLLPGW